MKEIKSKKSFLTLLITTCLILATTTFVPNIPAEGESCLDNLNAIFLSNAEELVEVQATRLVNDELNTAAENWTLEELNTFLEDLEDDQGEDEDDQGEDEDEELEFNPGYLSADQTFTAMVSYGFIPEGSRDLEAYRELYHDPYSLEGNVSLSRNFQVLKQYDFIPESLSQSDFRKLGGRMGLIIRGFEYSIPNPPAYEIIWETELWDALETVKVGIDPRNDDVVIVGYDSNYDGVVAKLDSTTGQIVWSVIPESLAYYNEQYAPLGGNGSQEVPPIRSIAHQIQEVTGLPCTEQLGVFICDVAVDSQGDVVIVAEITDYEDENWASDIYVSKLDGDDGSEMWDVLYDNGLFDRVMSVTVNSNDQIFITGISASLLPTPNIDGWVAKLSKNTGYYFLWKHNQYQNPTPWYNHIDCDSQDDVYVTGSMMDIEWSGDQGVVMEMHTVVTKYDGATLIELDEVVEEDYPVYDMAMSIAVDIDDNGDEVVAVAGIYDFDNPKQLLIKYETEPELHWIWGKHDIPGIYYDVAIWKNDVVATGYKDDVDEFYTAIHDGTTGALKVIIIEGGDTNIWAWSCGVAVDSDDYIITTGTRWYQSLGMLCGLTMKYYIVE